MSQPKTLTQSHLDESAVAVAAGPKPYPPVPTASWVAVQKLRESNPAVDYRPYPRNPNYIIGNDGSAWNVFMRRNNFCKERQFPKKIKTYWPSSKYDRFLCGSELLTLHGAVLETFHGERPLGKQAAHNDGNKRNNSSSNLRWATPKENQADRILHGTHLEGEKSTCVKLTKENVMDIRKRILQGHGLADISKDYPSVHKSNIDRIKRGDTWKCVAHTAADFTAKEGDK